MRRSMLAPLLAWLGRLSNPKLFLLAASLFTLSLLIPDPIPLVDELLFGLMTLLLARRKHGPRGNPRVQETPPRDPVEGHARRER